jgi:ferric-dicitrate binding protein FerR (iron transport regulator)
MSRSKAKRLIEAAGQGVTVDQSTGQMAELLGAVGLLKAAAPPVQGPDPSFASELKTSLVARYEDLVAGPEERPLPQDEAHPRGAGRRAWVAIPSAAAAVALIVLLSFVVMKAVSVAPIVATLKTDVGRAVVIEHGGKRHTVGRSSPVRTGDTVDVGGGSRASIEFRNGNLARLEAGTRVKVDRYGEKAVALAQKSGKVYSRVVKGASYSVEHGGVTVSTVGTAFDVEAAGRGLKALVFEGTVQVRWKGSRTVRVRAGYQAVVTFRNGKFKVEVKKIDFAALDFSWLAFNRDLDAKAGEDPGKLDALPPSPPEGTLPPENPGQPSQTTPVTPPGSTPGTVPGPQPTTPSGKSSVSMGIAGAGPPVVIEWSATNVGGATAALVLRAAGTTSPSFPGSAVIGEFGPGPSGSCEDTTVQQGRSYTYAIAYLSGGSLMAMSNSATVEVPAPKPDMQIDLGGDMSGDGMNLKWGSSGSVPDSWQVWRSEGGGAQMVAELPGGSAGGSFTDRVDPKMSYSWRIVGVVGGITFSSNSVSYP